MSYSSENRNGSSSCGCSPSCPKARDAHQLYDIAPNNVRRRLNQGIFEAIFIDEQGGVGKATLTPVFELVLSDALREEASATRKPTYQRRGALGQVLRQEEESRSRCRDSKNPAPCEGQGSSNSTLVGMKGLEPSRLSAHAPKACVSTNSTTSA